MYVRRILKVVTKEEASGTYRTLFNLIKDICTKYIQDEMVMMMVSMSGVCSKELQ